MVLKDGEGRKKTKETSEILLFCGGLILAYLVLLIYTF